MSFRPCKEFGLNSKLSRKPLERIKQRDGLDQIHFFRNTIAGFGKSTGDVPEEMC